MNVPGYVIYISFSFAKEQKISDRISKTIAVSHLLKFRQKAFGQYFGDLSKGAFNTDEIVRLSFNVKNFSRFVGQIETPSCASISFVTIVVPTCSTASPAAAFATAAASAKLFPAASPTAMAAITVSPAPVTS